MLAPHYVNSTSMSPNTALFYARNVEEKPFEFHTQNSFGNVRITILNPIGNSNAVSNIRKPSREYDALLSETPWVALFLQTASTLNTVKLLLPFYVEINKLIAQQQFDLCNSFLKYVRVTELTDVLLVGLLRLTYLQSDKLPYWKVLLSNSEKELRNRNYDSKTLLKGLV